MNNEQLVGIKHIYLGKASDSKEVRQFLTRCYYVSHTKFQGVEKVLSKKKKFSLQSMMMSPREGAAEEKPCPAIKNLLHL